MGTEQTHTTRFKRRRIGWHWITSVLLLVCVALVAISWVSRSSIIIEIVGRSSWDRYGFYLHFGQAEFLYGPNCEPLTSGHIIFDNQFPNATNAKTSFFERPLSYTVPSEIRSVFGYYKAGHINGTDHVVHFSTLLPTLVFGLLTVLFWTHHVQRKRRQGEAVCAECGYSLAGLDCGVCPECGDGVGEDSA